MARGGVASNPIRHSKRFTRGVSSSQHTQGASHKQTSSFILGKSIEVIDEQTAGLNRDTQRDSGTLAGVEGGQSSIKRGIRHDFQPGGWLRDPCARNRRGSGGAKFNDNGLWNDNAGIKWDEDATNYGEAKTQIASGMVSSFGGGAWQLANDPQPGVQDNSKNGSFIPAFGDAMYARYKVPIGVACTGYGGTSVRQ